MKPQYSSLLLRQDVYPKLVTQETNFGDVDMLGHLNNVAIARFYENVRARYNFELFDNLDFQKKEAGYVVLVSSTIDFLGEGFFPDPLIFGIGASRVGNSSYQFTAAMFQNKKCIGINLAEFVFVKDGASASLTAAMRSSLEANRLKI